MPTIVIRHNKYSVIGGYNGYNAANCKGSAETWQWKPSYDTLSGKLASWL